MKVFALDPGTTQTAYILFDGATIYEKGILPNVDLLMKIRGNQFSGEKLAIEMIASYGMAVGREVFETCVWIGRFTEASSGFREQQMVYRKDVKIHLCNSPRAKDGNIRQALIDKYGHPGTKKSPGMLYGISSHLWAALAVADYALKGGTQGIPAS